MKKTLGLFFLSILLLATTLGIGACFHSTVDRAADAVKDAVKKRTN